MTFKEKWNDAWEGFQAGKWNKEVNLRDFIQLNYTPYDGDDSFLVGPTQDTKDLWARVMELTQEERERGGVWDMDTKVVSTLTSHDAGYLDRSKEKIVGVQTDKPFKRSLQPFGGIRIAEQACETNGYKVDPVHPLPQDTQRRCIRCIYTRNQSLPFFTRYHRFT